MLVADNKNYPDTLESGDGCYNRCLNEPGCVAYRHYWNYPQGLDPWNMGQPSSKNGENTLCRIYFDPLGPFTEDFIYSLESDADMEAAGGTYWPASNTCIMVDPKTGKPTAEFLDVEQYGDIQQTSRQKM